jgi:hypothetical protein
MDQYLAMAKMDNAEEAAGELVVAGGDAWWSYDGRTCARSVGFSYRYPKSGHDEEAARCGVNRPCGPI